MCSQFLEFLGIPSNGEFKSAQGGQAWHSLITLEQRVQIDLHQLSDDEDLEAIFGLGRKVDDGVLPYAIK